jgi:MFS family permease
MAGPPPRLIPPLTRDATILLAARGVRAIA